MISYFILNHRIEIASHLFISTLKGLICASLWLFNLNKSDLQEQLDLAESECQILMPTGDRLAFHQFYKQYHRQVQAYAFRLIHCRELAQDIAQDVFLKLWENRKKLASVELVESYLFTMCRNRSLTLRAKVVFEQQLKKALHDCGPQSEEQYPDAIPGESYFEMLNAAIGQLPPARKLAFRLCKLEGKTYREAAEQLHVSTGTIHDHIVKATRAIRKFLYLCGSFQET